jgi:hypothetical protein
MADVYRGLQGLGSFSYPLPVTMCVAYCRMSLGTHSHRPQKACWVAAITAATSMHLPCRSMCAVQPGSGHTNCTAARNSAVIVAYTSTRQASHGHLLGTTCLPVAVEWTSRPGISGPIRMHAFIFTQDYTADKAVCPEIMLVAILMALVAY